MFQKKPLIIGNMKVLSIIALVVLGLGVVTFKSVTSLPKLKPTAAAPFDWHQFLPAAQKRAAAYPGDDPSSTSDVNAVYSAVPPQFSLNPMSPYLSLKPFLPIKPTMVAPFVDPNLFIGMKAALLNNLFGSGIAPAPKGTPSFIPPWISGGVISSPGFFAKRKTAILGTTVDNPTIDIESSSLGSKRALSEIDLEQEGAVSAQPRLVVGPPSIWGPPAGVAPTVKPTIVPPGYWSPFAGGPSAAGPVPPVADPSVFLDKKTKFLNDLFSSLSATPSSSEVSARAVVPDDSATDPSEKTTGVPPSFWLQFIPAFAATPPPAPTVKPTIVPPGFWIPTTVTKPVGFFGPSIPVVDPAQFADKKTAFLNTLFKTLNITVTPAPVTTPEPTLDPVTDYQQKVADFLDKLFTAIINNGSDDATVAKRALAATDNTLEDLKNTLGEGNEVYDSTSDLESKSDTRAACGSAPLERRSADEPSSTAAQQLPVDALLIAKDKVVDTIIAEMGGIKNNILDTLSELLAKQKEAAATPPPTPAAKKPGPPFGPGGPFGMGGPFTPWAKATAAATTPKPTPDPEPFQKKVEFLGQVFDTLTQLEKDVTEALNQAVSEAAAAAVAAAPTTVATPTTPETKSTNSVSQAKNGTTLIDLIRSKLIELTNASAPTQTTGQATLTQQVPKYARAIKPFVGKPTLPTPAPTIVDPSFWIPDTVAGAPVGPDYYIGKTQSFLSKLFASKAATAGDDDETSIANKVRSIKMAVHQGYQSLPPGSEELLQAGGGSTPQKHEGGGLKLQIKVPA